MKAKTAPTSGRDSSGRFRPGCAPGPGRPPKRVEERYGELLREVVDDEAFSTLLRAVYALACEGNSTAIRAILDRLIPVPRPGTEPESDPRDLPEGHEGDPGLSALSGNDLRRLVDEGALTVDPSRVPSEILVSLARADVKASNGSAPTATSENDDPETCLVRWPVAFFAIDREPGSPYDSSPGA